jgi:hypothetical protein
VSPSSLDESAPSRTFAEPTWLESAQLLLAEKRTALSVLRTGTSIFVLPLSVLSLLIATSKLYQSQAVWHLMIPLLVLCAGLIVLSIVLVVRALRNLRRYDRLLHELKLRHPVLSELIV